MFNTRWILISSSPLVVQFLPSVQRSGESLSICDVPTLLPLVWRKVPVPPCLCKRRVTFGYDIPWFRFRILWDFIQGVSFAVRNGPPWRSTLPICYRPFLSALLPRIVVRLVRDCTVYSRY